MGIDFYTLTTPPANDPVLFAGADEWCRDIDVADTTLVNALISSATVLVESMTNRVYVQRTFTGSFQCVQDSDFEEYSYIELRRSPLISVTSVKENDVLVSSDDYIVKNTSSFSRILFPSSLSLDNDFAYPIKVVFVAGYTTVPDDIITAIKQIVLFWYENRGDVSPDKKQMFPFVAKAILSKYRIINSFG